MQMKITFHYNIVNRYYDQKLSYLFEIQFEIENLSVEFNC